jgi:prepilin peptidase CpaA
MTFFNISLIFPALMAFAASYDSLSMRISNRLCLTLALAFFPAALAAGLPMGDIALHVACGLAMMCLGFAVFAKGWAGGGDIKLFAAAALWLGWQHIAAFAAVTVIAGGVLAVGLIAWRVLCVHFLPRHAMSGGSGEMPYGVALACGTLIVFPGTFWATGLAA